MNTSSFNFEVVTEAYVMGHHDIHFEIFISPIKERRVFSNICLAYRKVEKTY